MKERVMKVLLEYLKDSKRSDKEIAKIVGVSQPTITRIRQRLVKEGVIKEFTVIPDFVKMGYEIMAINCAKVSFGVAKEFGDNFKKWVEKFPNVIFFSEAQGMGKNRVMISLHKSYTDYSNFMAENLSQWGDHIEDYDTMIISLAGRIVKPLSLAYLAELKET